LRVNPPDDCVVALVTAPDLAAGRKIAKAALEQRLAACANILPQVESHYWWEGKLEQSAEVLIIFKTTNAMREALELCVLGNHTYKTPEFIVLRIEDGSDDYMKWLRGSVAS
jgi:periplasmic divalent cation tolerance protein